MVSTLADERYISLTTYKRDGTPVSTPVWVVSDDGERLLVWSAETTWKVRRVRRDPRVLVAASNFRGRERGDRLPAQARVIPDPGIDGLLRRKYGWQKRALDLLNGRADAGAWATIEIIDGRGAEDDLLRNAAKSSWCRRSSSGIPSSAGDRTSPSTA